MIVDIVEEVSVVNSTCIYRCQLIISFCIDFYIRIRSKLLILALLSGGHYDR